jgi:hypothetical protein
LSHIPLFSLPWLHFRSFISVFPCQYHGRRSPFGASWGIAR